MSEKLCSIKVIIADAAFPWCFAARRGAPVMAIVLAKRRNAAAGHHGSALRVGLSAPLDCVAPLAHILDIAGETRLAMTADKPTAFAIITLMEH